MRNRIKKMNQGITLIALVVTIVVLLILAGITIGNLTGNESIIKKANSAKEQTERSALEEQIEEAIMVAEIKYGNPSLEQVIEEIEKIDGCKVNKENGNIENEIGEPIIGKLDDYLGKTQLAEKSELEQAKEAGNVINATNPTPLRDKYGNKVVIPEGFKIASDSADDVTGGVVIEDVNHGATAGSQFVWIPVGDVYTANNTKTITLGRYVFKEGGSIDTTLSRTEPGEQLQEFLTSNYYYTEELKATTTPNTHAKDIEAFRLSTSVSKNGGYYIGRYEARIAGGIKRTAKTDDTDLSEVTVKENDYVYNYVTQLQGAKLSQRMYQNKEFESDLANSYAWDTAIEFIQLFSGDEDYSRQNRIQTTLAEKGKATDGSNYDIRCNIYDMSGNCSEWITETCSEPEKPCTIKGGRYGTEGYYTSDRNIAPTTSALVSISFRPILYL